LATRGAKPAVNSQRSSVSSSTSAQHIAARVPHNGTYCSQRSRRVHNAATCQHINPCPHAWASGNASNVLTPEGSNGAKYSLRLKITVTNSAADAGGPKSFGFRPIHGGINKAPTNAGNSVVAVVR
jgi:hypothetical protein